jgi:hypothetical protein
LYHFLDLFYFSIVSLIILFHLIFILNLVFLYVFNFGWLGILFHDFFMFILYRVIVISWHKSQVLKISLIWLRSFFRCFFKLNFFFQFHHSILGHWALSFVNLSTFLSIGLSRSHIGGSGLVKLTQVFLCYFNWLF